MSTGSPLRLVLFDVDGTLVDHDAAAAAAVEQWLMANHWADTGTIADLVSDWDAIAERHFPAYQEGSATFEGQRRLRLRDFLPRVGIDPSGCAREPRSRARRHGDPCSAHARTYTGPLGRTTAVKNGWPK